MLLREVIKSVAVSNEGKEPFDGIVFNRGFKIHGCNALLVSMSFSGQRATLWIIVNRREPVYAWERPMPFNTVREKLLWESSLNIFPFFIRAVEIEDRQINTHNSGQRMLPLKEDTPEWEQLRSFITHGMDLTLFEDVDTSELSLISIGFSKNILPETPKPSGAKIIIHTGEGWRRVLVNRKFSLRLNESPPDERLSFYDEHAGRERYFYLNKLELCNRWKEFEENEKKLQETDYGKSMSEEQLAEHLKTARASFEAIYPSGQDTVLIKYESEDEIQLEFHSTDALEQKPNERQAIGAMFYGCNGEYGPHGCNQQICELKGISQPEINSVIDFELIFGQIPVLGEIITV